MKIDVTPEQFILLKKLNDYCVGLPLVEPDSFEEYEDCLSADNYFNEAEYEKGIRRILGDEIADRAKNGEKFELIVKWKSQTFL